MNPTFFCFLLGVAALAPTKKFPTIAVLNDVQGHCEWTRHEGASTQKIASFPLPCAQILQLESNQDATLALAVTGPTPPGLVLIDIKTGIVSGLPAPTEVPRWVRSKGQPYRRIGFDAVGQPILLIDSGGQQVSLNHLDQRLQRWMPTEEIAAAKDASFWTRSPAQPVDASSPLRQPFDDLHLCDGLPMTLTQNRFGTLGHCYERSAEGQGNYTHHSLYVRLANDKSRHNVRIDSLWPIKQLTDDFVLRCNPDQSAHILSLADGSVVEQLPAGVQVALWPFTPEACLPP